MDLDQAREILRNHVRWDGAVDDAINMVLAHLDTLERRAAQVEGGHYLRYAPPVEVARWIRTGNREAQEEVGE